MLLFFTTVNYCGVELMHDSTVFLRRFFATLQQRSDLCCRNFYWNYGVGVVGVSVSDAADGADVSAVVGVDSGALSVTSLGADVVLADSAGAGDSAVPVPRLSDVELPDAGVASGVEDVSVPAVSSGVEAVPAEVEDVSAGDAAALAPPVAGPGVVTVTVFPDATTVGHTPGALAIDPFTIFKQYGEPVASSYRVMPDLFSALPTVSAPTLAVFSTVIVLANAVSMASVAK